MEERARETNQEADQWTAQEEFREDEEHDEPSLESDFLVELNLLIVFLSLTSMSSEDCMDCGSEEAMEKIREQEAYVTRLHTRRREIHDIKVPGKRAQQRFQPMIKDSRYDFWFGSPRMPISRT